MVNWLFGMRISNLKFKILLNRLYPSLFILLISLGIFLRFFNFNWGAPYYFHPDERNIASSVSQLDFRISMNPEFFAYGSLPIYTAYFLGTGSNFILNIFQPVESLTKVNFEQAIIILRTLSALISVAIIFLIFDLVKKSLNLNYAIFAASLTGLNVGLIQYSHFGTFEIWLTFLFLLLLKCLYEYCIGGRLLWIVHSGIVLGLLLSVKVSSIVIAPIIVFTILFRIFINNKSHSNGVNYRNFLAQILIVLLTSTLIVILTSPFIIWDYSAFRNSMSYESGVAVGTIDVFYTGGFVNTIPIIYQLLFVYPFILNPVNLILVLISIPFLVVNLIKTKEKLLGLTLLFFIAIFFSQAFFYVKWIRYYIPTIPFLIIILIFGIKTFIDILDKKHQKSAFTVIFIILTFTALLFSFSYFKTVLLNNDTRIEAANFAKENISKDSKIISEVYDLGIIPFNVNFQNITLFDFYALDNEWIKNIKNGELKDLIEVSDYLILPSQRILRNRTIYKDSFPEGHKFYSNLENNFDLIYKTPCDIYCKILYLGDPIYSAEETANVFDRPSVYIYKIN